MAIAKKMFAMSRVFTITFLLILICSCTSVREVQIDGLRFDVPADYQFRRIEQTNKMTEQAETSSAQSYILFMVSKGGMNAEAMLENMREMAPHMPDETFANMSMGEGVPVDFNGVKSIEADVVSSVKGQATKGKIIVATTNKRTVVIVALWWGDEQREEVGRILTSVRFVDIGGYGGMSLEDRMSESVGSLNRKLPQVIEDGIEYVSVVCERDSVIHSYRLLKRLNLSQSEIKSTCLFFKGAQIDELNELDGAMIHEWFDAKKAFRYVFYQPDSSEVFSFVVSKEDILSRLLEKAMSCKSK